MGWYREENGHC